MTTYTLCEDQPALNKYDVEIRTYPTFEKAENMFKRAYTADERNGNCDDCIPFIRNDATGDRVKG